MMAKCELTEVCKNYDKTCGEIKHFCDERDRVLAAFEQSGVIPIAGVIMQK